MAAATLLVGLASGFLIGYYLERQTWTEAAGTPHRVYRKGESYRVYQPKQEKRHGGYWKNDSD